MGRSENSPSEQFSALQFGPAARVTTPCKRFEFRFNGRLTRISNQSIWEIETCEVCANPGLAEIGFLGEQAGQTAHSFSHADGAPLLDRISGRPRNAACLAGRRRPKFSLLFTMGAQSPVVTTA
jgi:hypothetical protein